MHFSDLFSVCVCVYLHAARSEPGSSRGAGVPASGRCSAGTTPPQRAPAPRDSPRWTSREPNLQGGGTRSGHDATPTFPYRCKLSTTAAFRQPVRRRCGAVIEHSSRFPNTLGSSLRERRGAVKPAVRSFQSHTGAWFPVPVRQRTTNPNTHTHTLQHTVLLI